MEFYSKAFLTSHCQAILDFYEPRCEDNTLGGYFQNYYDDGQVFNPGFRQLVSSTRMVINFCRAARLTKSSRYLHLAKVGLEYLEKHHWREKEHAFAWTLDTNEPLDLTQQAYGYAFVLLCYAHCYRAKLIESAQPIERVWLLLEARFWQAEEGIYADTRYEDGRLCEYRGQNANMHLCEALIAAYEATNETRYLQRANHLARRFCFELADQKTGLVYEHYTPTLELDFTYNQHDPKNLYRPWGFQPGHQTEWAKLLVQLNRIEPAPLLVEKAEYLFNTAFEHAWDKSNGGLIYGFDTVYVPCDKDKYFWVQAESFAAAGLLYDATKKEQYKQRYQQIWEYSWTHFVDHTHGAWFRVLNVANQKYSNKKSEAGAKCDYHTLGACLDVLERVF
ncbi:D-mannose isomerase [Pseudoalteromonas luteoviolacea B = ATCC 29581]|nr:D-mannose isomerase [Pseudoalteromonas luteoviolacea B = ATCC 29581]